MSAIIFLIMMAAFPDSPIHSSSLTQLNLISIVPEGWAFFTRSPREENIYVYEKDKESLWKLVNIPGASPTFIFGLDRSGRAISAELQILLDQLPDSNDWVESRVKLKNFLSNDTLVAYQVKNFSKIQRCKGELIIQKVKPVPWAWSNIENFVMPYKIIKIYAEESK